MTLDWRTMRPRLTVSSRRLILLTLKTYLNKVDPHLVFIGLVQLSVAIVVAGIHGDGPH